MSGKKNEMAAPAAPVASGMAVHDYGKLKGKGFDQQTSADVAIPFLQLIQSNSPELDRTSPKYVPDARAGMFINTVTRKLYDGDKGVNIVPVDTSHVFIEWVPRDKGGGFRGTHAPNSKVVEEAKKAATGKPLTGKLPGPDGNDLVETFQMFAMILSSPDALEHDGLVLIPFTSTKIKEYRQNNFRLKAVKGDPPMFANRLRMISKPTKNLKGSFYVVELLPAVGKSPEESLLPMEHNGKLHPLLESGDKFLDAVRSGLTKVAYDSASDEPREPGSDGIF